MQQQQLTAKQKINRWLDAILNEDGENLSSGSIRTIKMIRDTLAQVQASAPPQTPIPSLKWVKVGDLFAQAPEVLGNQFEIDFGGNYMMQISNTGGIWRVTNAMDGWGNNCKEKFEESEVLILSSSPLPSTEVSPSLKWVKHFQPPFKQCEDAGNTRPLSYVLDSNGNIVLEIRGWGHLTNKMDEPEAANVQEQMARGVAAMLNASLQSISPDNKKGEKKEGGKG